MAKVVAVVGDPARIAALEAAEARLGVRFPDDYRRFVADRSRHQILVKRISFARVEKTAWTDDGTAVVIGASMIDGANPLVFKPVRGKLSDVVWELRGAVFKRTPRFFEYVDRERDPIALSDDDRTRTAERLGGGARRCRCGQEIRVGQVCACGHLGSPRDPVVALDAAAQAEARAKHPTVWRAWTLITALRAAGHVVPSGPRQLLATAEALALPTVAAQVRAMLAAWKATGIALSLDAATLRAALTA